MDRNTAKKHFSRIHIMELIASVFIILLGVLLLCDGYAENSMIDIIYRFNGVCFTLSGLIGAIGAFFTNKELIDGESYCWPVGRGPFTPFNNLVLGVLAVLLIFIMIAYDFNALSGIIVFSIASDLAIIDSMYGILFKNTKCIILKENRLFIMKGKSTTELKTEKFLAYKTSIRFAGFKLISNNNDVLMKWSAYWNGSEEIIKFLDNHKIAFNIR